MSVWKETWFELDDLVRRQSAIYDDACDCGFITTGTEYEMARDANFVKRLHEFVKENKPFGKIETTANCWKFTLEMLEGIEDGRKIGCKAEVSFIKNTPREGKRISFVSLILRQAR